jgi:glycosyltransferase involved in cell wall biosynthesis
MTLPRISIIVPSYNQGRFIEATLDSVLAQNYPALELIVMDGGSSDETVRVLKKLSNHLTYWESAPDRGQTHAINKGLARATGEIWAYLNSDDLLEPEALHRMAEFFSDPATDWIGAVSTIFEGDRVRGEIRPQPLPAIREVLIPWNRTVEYVFPCSNVCFMRRAIYERLGGFDESYHYSMDMEYYTRAIFAGYLMRTVPEVLGRWRWHAESKTQREGRAYRFLEEELRIAEQYVAQLCPADEAIVRREIFQQRRWFLVRRALHENPNGPRWKKLCRLFSDGLRYPSLFAFRPWLGAIKQQLI